LFLFLVAPLYTVHHDFYLFYSLNGKAVIHIWPTVSVSWPLWQQFVPRFVVFWVVVVVP